MFESFSVGAGGGGGVVAAAGAVVSTRPAVVSAFLFPPPHATTVAHAPASTALDSTRVRIVPPSGMRVHYRCPGLTREKRSRLVQVPYTLGRIAAELLEDFASEIGGGCGRAGEEQRRFEQLELHQEEAAGDLAAIDARIQCRRGTRRERARRRVDDRAIRLYERRATAVFTLHPKIADTWTLPHRVAESPADEHERQLTVFRHFGQQRLHHQRSRVKLVAELSFRIGIERSARPPGPVRRRRDDGLDDDRAPSTHVGHVAET